MTKIKLNSYFVLDCDNEIVEMGSGIECNRIARQCNRGAYKNKPYTVKYLNAELTITDK